VRRIEEAIGKPILGNKPASGTAIIEELGAEHLRTGYPIVYTSADSVLQIAAHEEVIPPPQLYEICRKVREIMTGEHAVARVIARPFVGSPGKFVRTPRRKDFSLPPPSQTVLDVLVASGKEVIGVGKIGEIFAFRGLSDSIKTAGNADTFRVFLELQKSGRGNLIWANFNDFDTLYGHRNNPQGFAQALQAWDVTLTDFLASMREEDLLIITSDHGCDPTTPSTDHSREYALLLVYSLQKQRGRSLGVRDTFCDVAHSIAELLGVKWHGPGTSFASEILS
jgi:phosphopentomutase